MEVKNARCLVKSLVPWSVGFKRINSIGDVTLPAFGKIYLDAEEIISQCYNNNKLFVGPNGNGDHASLYVEDDTLRKEVGFETDDKKQDILSDEKLRKLFDYKQMETFKRHLVSAIVTQAERFKIVEYIKKNKVNDYNKIKVVEEVTGIAI